MAKTKVVRVTDEELAALEILRQHKPEPDIDALDAAEPLSQEAVAEPVQEATATPTGTIPATPAADPGHLALANALITAINATKPPEKKNVFSRPRRQPWDPKPGEAKEVMRRKMYQHGIPISKVTNEHIRLLNQLKVGEYCDGWVKVRRRKDQGIDIDYPVKNVPQRLKLVNTYGIRSFTELLQRIIEEGKDPSKYRKPEDEDLYI